MTNPHLLVNRLITGMTMTRDEFLRAWEDTPDLKNAELIEGIVYVPSPVGLSHAEFDFLVHLWLGTYALHNKQCRGGANATCLMLESAAQPDTYLRVLPEFGGLSKEEQGRLSGPPELAVEICETSRAMDFGPKLALYQRAGVREYITIETLIPRVQWRILDNGSYRTMEPDSEGILRSEFFPGLWLDSKALCARNSAAVIDCLQKGIASTAP